MKLPISSWKQTLRMLGYRVAGKSGADRHQPHVSSRKRGKNRRFDFYELLEPRQMLAGNALIHVVDRGEDLSFQYDLDGNLIDTFSLQDSSQAQGATTSPDGRSLFIVNSNKNVLVLDPESNSHLGTWRANGPGSVEGIATDGTHIWIVDKGRDRVFFFEYAADNRWEPQSATGDFHLASGNRKPTGITTDGETIWVVDEQDIVFVYDTLGNSLGSWRLDSANRNPSGIAIDPSGGEGIWVLDKSDERVYFYSQGRNHRSGDQVTSSSFLLDSNHQRAEGIAINPADVTVDPPSIPIINSIFEDNGVSNTDGLTNDSTLLISGTADPGNTVTLTEASYGELGSATADNSGNWIVDATSITLPDGNHLLFAVAEDAVGNRSPSSFTLEIIIDTIAPEPATIVNIDSDTGSMPDDGVTSDSTLGFNGTADPGSILSLMETGLGPVGTATADISGFWQIDAGGFPLVDGTYHFFISSADEAGNTSQSNTLEVLIDSAAPEIPRIAAINDDSGISSSDGITNDSTLSITGLSESYASVRVVDTIMGLAGSTVADANGVWVFNLPKLPDGSHGFTATAEDRAGNISDASSTFLIVVDTIAPEIPTLDLDPLFDSAPAGDKTTDLSVVTLNGTTEPGVSVVLQRGLGPMEGPVANTVASASGEFSFPGVLLDSGANQFHVFATDLADNESVFAQTITKSTSDIDPPVIVAGLLNDTGLDTEDMATTDPTIVGYISDASPLNHVVFFLYSFALDAEYDVEITAELVDGEFELDQAFLENLVGGSLPYGQYLFCVDAEDVFGNGDFVDGEFLYLEADIGDVTPPDVTVDLLYDTGASPTDGKTSDGSLTGMVDDQSPVQLTVFIADANEIESGIERQGDITDLLQPNGTFVIEQDRLELILGRPLEDETYFVTVEATDQVNVGSDSLHFDYISPVSPPVIISVVSDTGVNRGDGVTSDKTLSFSGTASPMTEIELTEFTLGSFGTVPSDSHGDWIFPLSGPGLADGVYAFTALANASGEQSDPSNVFIVTVDTESPRRANFDLNPAFDTGVVGDSYTTTGTVTLTGITQPDTEVRLQGTGRTTIADAEGMFSMANVELALGRKTYEIVTVDTAGNKSVSRKSITYDQPITLSESGFVTSATQLIELGQDYGIRTVSFRIDTDFGPSPSGLEDSFAVYLVDPADHSSTLLDRGLRGTSLFSLIGDRPDYLPGDVRFDGSLVEIDVSSIAESSEGLLLFQLINNDGNTSTTISISNIGSIVDEDGSAGPVIAAPPIVAPGAPFDVSGLAANMELTLLHENIRYDSNIKRYDADLRVRNDGADLGRSIVITFESLAGDVSLLNASGIDGSGNPYVSMREAIADHGLLSGQVSDAVHVEFSALTVSPFAFSPIVSDGGPNAAPDLEPIGILNVTPGHVLRIDLSATDADSENFYYSILHTGDLPNTTLTATGQLVIAPGPDQIGNYTFAVVATDGALSSSQPVTLNVVPDAVTTTRISGLIMDTHSVPLAGILVGLGETSVLTAADGSFELVFAGALPDNTLKVHGETYAGPEIYPLIAEKLSLLYGHDVYENVNNFIERPIYLPALDIANGATIDPAADITVTTSAIPNASVFVAAGTLDTQEGGAFEGVLSITEVPADFTPAALPADLFPDMVVTIQPGEMVFTTPAPLNLPNLAGYLPGTEMTLWSINPHTGLFDDVGVGLVGADGTTVETVSGGINNSSWHFFAPVGPVIKDPKVNPRNQDKACNLCEMTDTPNADNQWQEVGEAVQGGQELDTGFIQKQVEAVLGAKHNNPSPAAGGSNYRPGGLDGGWGTGGSSVLPSSGDFGPYGSWGSRNGASVSFSAHGSQPNVTPSSNPILAGNNRNANDTEVALHSGAVYRSHDLTPYQSLGSWHGMKLNYDSERADARPIVSTGFNNIQNNLPDPVLATKLTLSRGNLRVEVPGFTGIQPGLTGGEHFFRIPLGAQSMDVAIQADMRSLPTGVYEYESTNRFIGNASGSFIGTASMATDRLVHVNTLASPFGAGWGLSGLLEIVENPDGSALLIDGNGGEYLFEAPAIEGEAYESPAGDFSALVQLGDGSFQRTHVDQTVEFYGLTNKLASIIDRNGNLTRFQYDVNDNIEFIIDPVGLTTIFRYDGGRVAEIEDPTGRITAFRYQNGNLVNIRDPDNTSRTFSYDSMNRLTREVDKLGEVESLQYGFSGRIGSVTRKDRSTVSYSPIQPQGLRRPEQTNHLASQIPASDFGSLALAAKTDANGNVTEHMLDKQGQLLGSNDAEGDLPELARNQNNLVERVVDARGNLTIFNYDDRGNVVAVSDVISRGSTTDPLFIDPIYPVVQFTNEIVAADINGDGFVDVISESGTLGDSVSVQLGNGAGGFSIGATYRVVDPVSLQVADVNNDSKLDVVTTNIGNQVSVLLGNGDGTLQIPESYPAGSSPNEIQTADFNGDGFVDLATTDSGGDTVSILLGDGTGQFNSRSSMAVADSPRALAIGDINNDGLLDIVVGNHGTASGLSILLGNGDGSFAPSTFVPTDAETEFVVLADFTGDNDLDVITGDSNLVMLRGWGDGTFGAAEITNTGSTTGSLKSVRAILIDVELDGDQDLIFADSSIAAMRVFENDGAGNFRQGQTIATGGNSMMAADVNFDGVEDIITLATGIVSVIGTGEGSFVAPPVPSTEGTPVGDEPTSLAVADFNNDGHQDIVVGSRLDNRITVMLGAGDGTLTSLTPIASAGLVVSVAATDLNNDGNADLVTAHYDLDRIEVRYGDGSGGFSTPVSVVFPGQGPLEIKFGEFNNDSNLDIAIVGYRESSDPGFSIAFSNGDGTFAAGPLIGAAFEAATIDVGDINEDGNLDVVVGVSYFGSGNAARPYFGNGDGTFVDQGQLPFGGGVFAGPPKQLKLVDLDDDGDLEIIGLDEGENSLKVLQGTGNGAFETVVSYAMDSGPGRLETGDVNGDGIQDVIATNFASNRVSIFLGRGNGTLTSRQDFVVGNGPSGIKLVDLDEDGSLDFVTADSRADAISIRINSTDIANQAAQVFAYDPVFSQVTTSIDEEGRMVIYDIDSANGNTLSMTQVIGIPGGGDDIVTSFTYTSHGLIDTVTDPLGRVTDMDYNAAGLLAKVTFAVGTNDEASISYEYDAAGNQTAIIDELGHRTETVYDALNRMTQIIGADPDGAGPLTSPVTTNTYDGQGNLVKATDALNNTTQFFYDEQYRLIETIDANLNSITHQHDAAGNLIATIDRLGRRSEFVYDQRNRLIETIDAAGGRSSKYYDQDNNVVAMVDANGVITRYVFDARNRLVRTTDALGGRVRYEYDRVDNLVAMIDEIGRSTEMTFDDLNRITSTTLPNPDPLDSELAPVTTFAYDNAGNVISTTDALGNTTTRGYDDRDRLILVTEPDPDDAGPLARPVWINEYDDSNRLVRTTDPLGRESSFVYDALNRLLIETLPDPDGVGPEFSPQTTYTYDAVDNRRTETDALGNTTVIDYDRLYRIVSIVQPDPDDSGPLLNPTTTFVLDAEGQIEKLIDPLGRTTIHAYDQLGRLVTETLPDSDGPGPESSPVLTHEYDGIGNQVVATDALGNATRFVYDDLYRLVRIIEPDPDGVAEPELSPTRTMKYDAAHQLVSTSDPLNRTTTYQYDGLGRVVRKTFPDPDGIGPDMSPELTYAYDLMNNQLSATDALGNATAYAYDNLYRLVKTTESDPDGAGPQSSPETNYFYDIASQLLSTSDPLNRTTVYEYDNLGRLISVGFPDPDGAGPDRSPVTTHVYDLMNNELSVTDALGNLTQFEYDNLYRMTSTIQADPDGSGPQTNPISLFEFDIAGQMTSKTDPLGRVTSYDYDQLGRVVREIYPDPDGVGPLVAPEMTYEFDRMNNRLSMTDAVGNLTRYEYDNLYRLTRMIDSDPDGDGPIANPVTRYSYDIASQLLSTADPLNRTSSSEYDNLGRVIRVTQPDPDGNGPLAAPQTSYVYDAMNNLLSMTDPLGHVTWSEYDNLYRVVRVIGEDLDGTGPLTHPTTDYAYDLVDNLLSLQDSSGNQTQYAYDDLDRVFEEMVELESGTIAARQFEYDAEDNLIRRTDRNNRVIEYEYDVIYRRIEERWLDAANDLVNKIQFEFDEANQMLRAEDLTIGSRHTYAYDDLGRVTQSVVNNGGPEVEFTNAYDSQSRPVASMVALGGVNDFRNIFTYDGVNRLIRLDQDSQAGGSEVADKRVDFGYFADDQLSLISRYKHGDGGVSNVVLQSAYSYDGIGRLNNLIHSSPADTISDYDWTYDAASRITQLANSVDGLSSFRYDNTNQLTGATHAARSDEAYDHDEDGNRINAGYSTGLHNRLTTDETYLYDYDAEGNRTKRTNIATGAVTRYFWDYRNRLVSVTEQPSDGGAVTHRVEHRYDVFNRWISKTVDADGDGTGVSAATRYEYNGNQVVLAIDEFGSVTNRYLWVPGVDVLLADEQVGNQVYWTASDHLGSVRDVIDSNGNVANHIIYDAFGNIVSETVQAVDVLVGFTGRPWDEATGLQNNLHRWLDPTAGRWLNEDPVAFQAGDTNLYRYVGNNSTNLTDPEGLVDFWNSRLGRGLFRIYHQPLESARVFVDPVKRSLEKTEMGRFGLDVGETTLDVGGTLGKAFYVDALPYLLNDIGPAMGELAAIQGTRLMGNAGLAEKIHRNSRFSQTRALERYIANHGAVKARTMLEEALVYADLAAHVYSGAQGSTVQEFELMKRYEDEVWHNSGFQAGLYHNSQTGKYVLAFEGTNPALSSRDGIRDICQDLKQGFGRKTEQYELAIKLAERIKKRYGDELILSGHSLGGGLATAAALVHNLPAYVIDPAGVHPKTIGRHGADFSRANELVNGVRLHGEFLTTIVNTAPGAAPTQGNINTIPASKFHDPFSGHSSALAANYVRDLLGIPRPPED